ncbi:MAG TPA: Ig-like domain-containing protein, partial [Verrucomicrobiota bacterium]|nr:Ig-like domain-containing protein [Verrucomicrobiota bacterium]
MRNVFLYLLCLFITIVNQITLKSADTTPPVVQSTIPAQNSVVNTLTNITVIFSEPITGIAWDDLLINGNPGFSLSGKDQTWTFSFDQPPPGPIVITFDPNHNIHDLSGNRFDETNVKWAYTLIDNIPPSIISITPQPGIEIRGLSQIEITFNETVVGIDASDLLINGQPATNLTVLVGYKYVFKFPPAPAGNVIVSWAQQHNITDATNHTVTGSQY